MNKAINTNNAPAAIGPYSQAIEANGMVFASGQLPIDPATGNFAEGGIKELTRQSLTNIKNILEAAGTDMKHAVKMGVFLADMADFAEMNEVYAEFFEAPFPARSAVAVKTLPKNARVEIECLAAYRCNILFKLLVCRFKKTVGKHLYILFALSKRGNFKRKLVEPMI